MEEKVKSLKVGDYVFAKLKGYPPWPAKITSIGKTKCEVFFYGDRKTASIYVKDCFNYAETKAKHANEKCRKKANFQTAVDEIELAIKADEDTAPIAEKPVISRHGRIIKPKRYLREESEKEHLQTGEELEEEDPKTKKQRRNTLETEATSKATAPVEMVDDKSTEHKKKVLLEKKLLEHNHSITSCIQLTSTNIDRAIELMNSFQELTITKFMLKKHPIVVDTMKRLRWYVGNTKNWGFTDEQKQEFDEKAKKVRNLAASIYNNFKKLFDVPEGRSFYHVYEEEVRLFLNKVDHFSLDQLMNYVDDEGEDENNY